MVKSLYGISWDEHCRWTPGAVASSPRLTGKHERYDAVALFFRCFKGWTSVLGVGIDWLTPLNMAIYRGHPTTTSIHTWCNTFFVQLFKLSWNSDFHLIDTIHHSNVAMEHLPFSSMIFPARTSIKCGDFPAIHFLLQLLPEGKSHQDPINTPFISHYISLNYEHVKLNPIEIL